jgi:hypothetical protein
MRLVARSGRRNTRHHHSGCRSLCGVHPPTTGRILIDGGEVRFSDPSDSQAKGIKVVYQDLALAERQPVRSQSRRRLCRQWDELCELPDVLGDGCQVGLVAGAVWSS